MNTEIATTLLHATLFAPLLGIPLILALRKEFAKYAALGSVLLTLGLGLGLYTLFLSAPETAVQNGFTFLSSYDWFHLGDFDIKFTTGVDGISIYMVMLTVVLFPLLVMYAWKKERRQEKVYYVMLLLLQTGSLGYFLSLDMLMFYVFFEMVLIPTCFFIGIWGGAKREMAAVKFFLYTLVGSLIMLIAIIYMGVNVVPGVFTSDYFALRDANFGLDVQKWLFIGLAFGFAVKVPLFPLHTWQPQAYSESNTTGSVVLAAVMSKMGAYGFIRFCLPFFPEVAYEFAPYFCALAVVSIIVGAILAVVQTNIKKLIAYGSMSHLGFIVLGIFAMTPEALSGAVLHMLGHGVVTAALFLLAGMIYERHKTKDIRGFQGIAKEVPRFALLFMITVMASVGLPGLSGFVGEFMIIMGVSASNSISIVFAILAAVAMILAAVYLINMFRKMMFGKAISPAVSEKMFDLNRREMALMLPLIAMMFMIGVYTTPYLTQINKGSEQVIEQLSAAPATGLSAELEELKLKEEKMIEDWAETIKRN